MRVLIVIFLITTASTGTTRAGELGVSGSRFTLNGQLFPYTGMSFFNAIYNTNFNASSEVRTRWLKKFHSYGINVLRVWCQWDCARGFVDAASTNTLYNRNGALRPHPLQNVKAILTDADKLGISVELVLFSQESWREFIRIGPPADERAVAALTRELRPHRNLTFQIWNEHDDDRVLPLIKIIKSIDPKRLVSNSPGYAGVMGSDVQNAELDYLSPHTTRHGREPHWEVAPRELEPLIAKFKKPVVDDEPARNGTSSFGGPKGKTSPQDHIRQIQAIRRIGAYPTYHHDMFQTGYGTPACPPSGIPDPEFSPYHREVFEFLRKKAEERDHQ